MRIDIVTLFPDFFKTPLLTGILEDALQQGIATVGFVDPRAFATDRHRTVDDTPYGGGGGMLMKVEPLASAIAAASAAGPRGPVILTSPQGKPLEQRDFERWSREQHLVIVCGRYEGIDERITTICDEEISIGDFVLTGGEYAALVILDGVIRLLPGTLGNVASSANDSFSGGLLEGPHYTRPPEWRGLVVPEALFSGHHAAIAELRRRESIARTRRRRPDLLREVALDKKDRAALAASPSALPPISIALSGEDPATIVEAGRLARAYGIEDVTATRDLTTLQGSLIATALPFPLKNGPPVLGPRALIARAVQENRRIVLALGAGFFENKKLAEGIEVLLPSIRPAGPAPKPRPTSPTQDVEPKPEGESAPANKAPPTAPTSSAEGEGAREIPALTARASSAEGEGAREIPALTARARSSEPASAAPTARARSSEPEADRGLGRSPNDLSLLETLAILLDRLAGEG